MNLYDEFSDIVQSFKKHKIRFAVVGGLAMAFHDTPRFTRDIDILLHSKDADRLADVMTSLGYFESATPWSLQNAPLLMRRFVKVVGEDHIPVDILIGKARRIDTIVDRAVSAPWSTGKVRVARKQDIISLKRVRGSDQDKVDIRNLKK